LESKENRPKEKKTEGLIQGMKKRPIEPISFDEDSPIKKKQSPELVAPSPTQVMFRAGGGTPGQKKRNPCEKKGEGAGLRRATINAAVGSTGPF